MDRGVWWATVHGVLKSQTWLNTPSCSAAKSKHVVVNLYHASELPGKLLQNEDLWVLIFKARLRTTALDLCFSNFNMLMNFITTQLVIPFSKFAPQTSTTDNARSLLDMHSQTPDQTY